MPKYQGGNAISWAIYNEEKYTGATWHYVDNNIDTGDIIWQKLIRIDEDAKAYEISKESMMCAFEGFQLFFIPLLESKIKGKPQETAEEKSFHFRSQLPHGGCINIYDPPQIIYKLLRAMDYGKVGNHVRVRIKMSDKEIYEVQSYKLEEGGLKNEVIFDIQKGYVYIPIGERRIKIKLIN